MTGTNQTSVTNVNGGTLSVYGSLDSPVTSVNDSGTLTVNGAMTSETVSVNAGGALGVNGVLTSPLVTINPGGELQGRGNITGFVDDRGGEIEPGNSIGTLHIFGPLEMEPHSEYQVQINGASSDQIQVSEKATIESSTFEIERYNTASSPVVPGKTYTILTTSGGLTVKAPTVAIADFPFINFTLSEDGFNGYLTTSRSAERFAELASTPNEAAVANALDTATSSLAWQQVVGASTAEARAAFSSLSNASIHASAAGVLSEQSHFLRDAVLDRLRQDFPVSAAAGSGRQRVVLCRDAPAARRRRAADEEGARRRGAARARLRGLGAGARQLGLALGQQQCGANQRLDRRRDLRHRRHLQSHVPPRLRRRLQPVELQFREHSGVRLRRQLSLRPLRRLAERALGFARRRQLLLERPQHVATGDGGRSRGRAEQQLCRQDVARLRRGRAQFRLWPGRSSSPSPMSPMCTSAATSASRVSRR